MAIFGYVVLENKSQIGLLEQSFKDQIWNRTLGELALERGKEAVWRLRLGDWVTCHVSRFRGEHAGRGAGRRDARVHPVLARALALRHGQREDRDQVRRTPPGHHHNIFYPLHSTHLNACIWRRNTTDVMLHLIQPRFKNIFGEHYYRFHRFQKCVNFMNTITNYIWTEQWSRTCSGRPTRWWYMPTSSWTPTRTTSTTATPSGSHPRVSSGSGSGSSFQLMYTWRGLL